jgi:hypothetical protein
LEREAFDLFGIVFEGHLICAGSSRTTASSATRSARTSLIGNVEVCYDMQQRVIRRTVIVVELRVLVPRVTR